MLRLLGVLISGEKPVLKSLKRMVLLFSYEQCSWQIKLTIEFAEVWTLTSRERLAMVLILLGGILGLVIALVSFSMIPFMAGVLGYGYGLIWEYGGLMMGRYGMFGYPQFELGMMPTVMVVWSLIGLVGASLSVLCGLKLRREHSKHVALIGSIGGVLLLLTFSWLPGVMVLAGSVMVYFE